VDDLDLATPDLEPLLAWLRQATAAAGSPLARALLAVEPTLSSKSVYRQRQSCASVLRTVRWSASTGAESRKSPSLGGPFPGRLSQRCGTRDVR